MSTIQPPRTTSIRSPLSSTQIPTLNSNHTHPHPHRHPPSTLLHQPSDSPKRSISYSATPTGTHPGTPVSSSSATAGTNSSITGTGSGSGSAIRQKEKHDNMTCDHKVKGALTELLNDGSVKADERGRRSVQRLLMETERELRTQRRESLSLSGKAQGKRKGRTRGEEMGSGNGIVVERGDDEDGGLEGRVVRKGKVD
ncbi:hypothetical protein N8T08_009898 [Aspergillus melleus]|uniref:Uncharacterized protein n=1 Tax=Aspergillus melleus TaxID=138277 RepID=A0ACC3ATB2_9EURO|nr:hypothetical protein N8T08_009898 [Aspergillus melleus]